MWPTLRRLVAAVVAVSPRKAAAAVLVAVGLSLAEGVGLLMLIPLLALVGVDAQSGATARVVSTVGALFASVGVHPTLGVVLAVYVAIAAVQGLLQRWQGSLTATLREDFTAALRERVYLAIARAEWVFVARRRVADFTQILTDEVWRVGLAVYDLIDVTVVCLVSIVYLALAFRLSPAMASLVSVCGGTLLWLSRGRLEGARASGARLTAARRRLHAAISDHLGSMKTAKSYGVDGRHAAIFTAFADDLRDLNRRATSDQTRLQQRMSLSLTVLLAVIVYVSYQVLAVPAAQLLVLLFIFARLMPRLTDVYRRVQVLAIALPAFEAVTDLETRCLAAAEPRVAAALPLTFQHGVRFERVSFGYDADQPPALADLTLDVRAGTTTAIVGASGAGKSTLADLLTGLLWPTTGYVVIDGQPLDAARLASWRAQIGYVPQETFLFHDTVRANLQWAKPDAEDHDLWHALRLAAADGFVASLPHGLETVVGDRGVLLSGGERQRLALARALVRRPRLLILDEATSSLDSENERRIQQAIDGLRRQMTIVIITHRLSTIRGADVVHVLDDGRLVESGSWTMLAARPRGRFIELCQAQGLDDRSVPV